MKKEKTILEWFEQAKADGYEWADAAINNITGDNGNLDEISLSEAIAGAFSWEDSVQGHEYWQKIYTNVIGESTEKSK